MLSYLIFNSSVDRGIPSLAAGPFDPAILNRRNRSTCCVEETPYLPVFAFAASIRITGIATLF